MSKKKMVSVSATELKKMQKKLDAQKEKAKKKAESDFDGLSPVLKKKIRIALRQIWQRSKARKICLDRVTLPDGYSKCESPQCEGKKYPKAYIDHVIPAGELDSGFIKRLFVPSTGLQGLCKECHKEKTKKDNAKLKKKTKGA